MNIREIRKAKLSDLGVLVDTPTVTENADKQEVLKKIAIEPHFVVVTSGPSSRTVKGVITASDVDKAGENANAATMMSGNVIVATIDQTVEDVAANMKQNSKSVLPVVNQNNEFLGVITGSKLRQKIASDVQLSY